MSLRTLPDNGQGGSVHLLLEVSEHLNPAIPYNCITDNPGFQAVCLNRWVLQAAWYQYRQQYGDDAYEGPNTKYSTCSLPSAGSMVLGNLGNRNTSCSPILYHKLH